MSCPGDAEFAGNYDDLVVPRARRCFLTSGRSGAKRNAWGAERRTSLLLNRGLPDFKKVAIAFHSGRLGHA